MTHRSTIHLRRMAGGLTCSLLLALGLAGAALAAGPGEIPKPPGANPDNRGWEKVSPDEKAGIDILGGARAPSNTPTADVRSSTSGNAAMFMSYGVFAGAPSGGYPSVYRAVRGEGGWTTRGILPPFVARGSTPNNSPYVFWVSPDLSRAILSTNAPLVPGAPPGVLSLYSQDMDTLQRTLLTPDGPPPTFFPVPIFGLAASPDGRHSFFLSRASLVDDAPASYTFKLYEVVDGQTRLASRRPDGTATFVYMPGATSIDRMVSDDLRRAFFLSEEGVLYLHQDGASSRVSPPNSGYYDKFVTASPDGSRVLYGASMPDGVGNHTQELQILDVESGERTLVVSTDDRVSAVKASDDLDRVYYTVHSELWLWESGARRHIATLEPRSEDPNDLASVYGWDNYNAVVSTIDPEGSALAFTTRSKLTNFDNQGRAEVYRYEAESGELSCVSCPAGDGPSAGESALTLRSQGALTSIPPGSQFDVSAQWTRTGGVSAGGKQVFFQTSRALVAEDVNGRIDVYRWKDGQASLVSSGTESDDAWFRYATPDGGTALFTTRGRLVAEDEDKLIDVYAARVNGGFPEPPAASSCSGDGCQGPAGDPPAVGRVGSPAFDGRGSVSAARPARMSVMAATLRGRVGRLRVQVSRAGSIVVSGRAVRRARKSAGKAGTHVVRVALEPKARRTLRRRGRVRVAVLVVLRPRSGVAISRRMSLLFKKPGGIR